MDLRDVTSRDAQTSRRAARTREYKKRARRKALIDSVQLPEAIKKCILNQASGQEMSEVRRTLQRILRILSKATVSSGESSLDEEEVEEIAAGHSPVSEAK